MNFTTSTRPDYQNNVYSPAQEHYGFHHPCYPTNHFPSYVGDTQCNQQATKQFQPYQCFPHQQHKFQHNQVQRNQNQKPPKSNYNNPSTNKQNVRCDPCSRTFPNELALNAHFKTHVKCESPGCHYAASHKAVKLHFIQMHAEGKFRICLETPEKVAEWREERRKNWPSLTNITAKKHQQENDKRAGIVVESKEFVYSGNCKSDRQEGVHSKKRNDKRKMTGETRDGQHSTNKKEVVNGNNALDLLKSYDESEEEENNSKTMLPEGDVIANQSNARVDEKKVKKQKASRELTETSASRKVSLLEMLLSNEIRHERNVILQCIRYIVQNKFFES